MSSKLAFLVTFSIGALVGVWLATYMTKTVDGPDDIAISTTLRDVISCKRMDNSKCKLLVVTRIHVASASAISSVTSVLEFVKHALKYTTSVLVCVRIYYLLVMLLAFYISSLNR